MGLFTLNPPRGSKYHDPSKAVGSLLYDKASTRKDRPKMVTVEILEPWKHRKVGQILRVKPGLAEQLVKAKVAKRVNGRRKSAEA